MSVTMIARRITISAKYAEEKKLTDALPKQGWKLDDGTWSKLVNMPLYGKSHHSGGVPDIGEPDASAVVDYVNALIEDKHMPAKSVMAAVLNGVYLYFNDLAKPTATTSYDAMFATFCKQASSLPVFAEFIALNAGGQPAQAKELVKTWFAGWKPATTATA